MSIKNSTLKKFLPYGKQFIDQSDIDAVVNVLKPDYLTQGPVIGQFESAFKERGKRANIVIKSSFFIVWSLLFRTAKVKNVTTFSFNNTQLPIKNGTGLGKFKKQDL